MTPDRPASGAAEPTRRPQPDAVEVTGPGSPGQPRARWKPSLFKLTWLRQSEGLSRREVILGAAVAVMLGVLAANFKLAIENIVGGDIGWLPYVGAVALSAWLGGLGAGLITTIVSAGLQILLTGSSAEPPLTTTAGVVRLSLFIVDGVLVSAIASALRRASFREHRISNANEALYLAEREARETADQVRLDLERLQSVTGTLAGALTPAQVAGAIVERGMAAIDAAAGSMSRIGEEGRTLELMAARGYASLLPGAHYRLRENGPLLAAIRERRPIFVTDRREWLERYPGAPPAPIQPAGPDDALAAAPLIVQDEVIGLLVFRFQEARDFADGTGALVARLADHGSQALGRALAYESQRRAREALERGQARLRFLARASSALVAPNELQAALDEVAAAAAPAIADWAIIAIDEPSAQIAAAAHRDANRAADLRDLGAAPGLLAGLVDGEAGEPRVLVLGETTPGQAGLLELAWLDRLDGLGAETRAALDAIDGGSVAIAPIRVEDQLIGAVALGSAWSDRFEPDDVAMLNDLASRIGVAAAQRRLYTTVRRFKSTVDASLDAVFMFDPDTLRLTYVNRGAAVLAGTEEAVLVGSPLVELLEALGEAALRDRLAELGGADGRRSAGGTIDDPVGDAPAGGTITITGMLARRDGGHVPIEALVQRIALPDGAAVMVLSARDVSERVSTQARLSRMARDERRQAAALGAVLEAMHEGILVVGARGRIRLTNGAARQILGDVPADLGGLAGRLGLSPQQLTAPPAPGVIGTAANDRGRAIEVAVYPAELGESRGGGVSGADSTIVVLRDVTQAREIERAREAFVGVLSHELRTPVTTIYGYAKVLQRPDRDADLGLLADIEAEADRLYRIVEDLLALSRVEGGLTIAGEPLLIQRIVADVMETEARRWPDHVFRLTAADDVPTVAGERTYVEQVARNLLSNAAKYSPAGSMVTVTVEPGEGCALVRVEDEGPGFNPLEAERLFELYYRAPGAERRAAGAGIGLYVCRGLVVAMGGRIWATPRPGGGSDFGFTLPAWIDDLVD